MKRGDDCSWSRIAFFGSFFCLVASFDSPGGGVRGLRNQDIRWHALFAVVLNSILARWEHEKSGWLLPLIEHIISFLALNRLKLKCYFPETKIADDTISSVYQYFSINVFLLITENFFSRKVWRKFDADEVKRFFQINSIKSLKNQNLNKVFLPLFI